MDKPKNKTENSIKLDEIDIRIMQALQKNADCSIAQLAGIVGLSATPCWNRIQRLTNHQYIQKKVALLNPEKVFAEVVVFMEIKASHNQKWLSSFEKILTEFSQITEAFRMSGEIDYLLKIQVANIKEFDLFYKKLVSAIDIEKTTSNIVLEVIKSTTELNLDNLKKANGI